ncbi:hypothetical protein [Falsarthrobacter nasiphocae]|uniref:Uncharacterized protein n=2 Tax=Falsarthrobacter nasiphocae TaxID=189863 RepID=A0AAE4C5R7_9MICC|nr:hypothetical protein [Falsarthrobacter nasiphocae]MDR6892596.1 hypothetical protein [Falsarthrobacter nasiphocae]
MSISHPLEPANRVRFMGRPPRRVPEYDLFPGSPDRTLTMVSVLENSGACDAPVGSRVTLSVGATGRRYVTTPEYESIRVASFPELVSVTNGVELVPSGAPYETQNVTPPHDIMRRQDFRLATPLKAGERVSVSWRVTVSHVTLESMQYVTLPAVTTFTLDGRAAPDLDPANDTLVQNMRFTIRYRAS